MNRILPAVLLIAATCFTTALAQNSRSFQRPPRGSLELPTSQTPTPRELAEPYRQLLEVSIFARDRAAGDRPAVSPPAPPVPNAENYLTFRGVADDGERILGFLEDSRDGSALRVRIDDPLANGRVRDIDSSRLVYERKNGAQSIIPLGSNLAGVEMMPAPTGVGEALPVPSRDSARRPTFDGNIGMEVNRPASRTSGRPGRNRGTSGNRQRGGFGG